MRLQSLALSAAALCLTSSAFAQPTITIPVLVTSTIDRVFVPQGFDDNDNVEVILNGVFTNSCYSLAPPAVVIDKQAKKIFIEPVSILSLAPQCRPMKRPFIQAVKLGLLPQGNYSVEIASNPNTQTQPLNVALHMTENIDNYAYAGVESVRFEVNNRGEQALILEGTNPIVPNGCFIIDEVRFSKSPGNVLVTLPIAKLSEGEACANVDANGRFSHRAVLNEPISGEWLVHVRSHLGESVNVEHHLKVLPDDTK